MSIKKKKEKIDLGELKFEFNELDYDSDAEIKRIYGKKKKLILGQSESDILNKAVLRAKGVKVKDDINLIKKSEKRKFLMKKKSAKLWNERLKFEAEKKERRQKRRERNIEKRKQQKKDKRIKRRLKK